ncbi:DUF4270 family protein [Pontibacter actiniarum]|uniref:DUF4270 domain-containing protein n=1 Tax=Pontibacter actiniarum TaxID=323450 RepID=A0A1X9YWN7_9BACT|nr:DUF4270 family protein [Pontibacter actiniarum]ARS37356.1 hypothetical protein CA264_19100 [Pontibacter actiniarum]
MLLSKTRTLFTNKFNYLLCCLGAALALSSCEDPNELGLELVEDNVSGKFTDTLTVDVSTVLLDSVYTSGTGALLVGQYATPQTGTLNASTYFQLGIGSAATIGTEATYDSIKLVLPLSGYYYGDTTNAVTYEVYELNSDLKLRELPPIYPNERPVSDFYRQSALYNKSKIAVKDEPLTSFTFQPGVAKKDTLQVDLPDALGQAWFDIRKAGGEQLKQTSNFITYFKGLGIKASQSTSVLGFNASSGVMVQLYYSEPAASGGTRVAKTLNFPLNNPTLQFNRITSDFTGSPLEGLKDNNILPASATNGMSVAQAGTGLMIKLELPYLEQLKAQLKPEFINKAVLVIEPLRSATTTYPYPVPTTVGIYRTNQNTGVTYSPLPYDYDTKGSPVVSGFVKDSENATTGHYEFSITEYLISRLKNEQLINEPLYIAPASGFNTAVSRLVVGAQDKNIKNIKLKVYYTTIQ